MFELPSLTSCAGKRDIDEAFDGELLCIRAKVPVDTPDAEADYVPVAVYVSRLFPKWAVRAFVVPDSGS